MERATPLHLHLHLHWIRLKSLFCGFCAAAIIFASAPYALAQHGGSHAGGGHFGSPHVSAPTAPHYSAPARIPLPPAAHGTHAFAAPPPPAVRLITPPAANRPVIGNQVTITPSPVTAAPSHYVIGFPPSSSGRGPLATVTGGNPSVLSFSGQGHEIWRDSITGTPSPVLPRRPIYPRPVYPVFGGPIYGFGSGLGFGWGWGTGWGLGWVANPWSDCWSFGCNAYTYFDYGYGGYGYYGNVYSPGYLEGQIESQQNGPAIYENDSEPAVVYGDKEQQLVELFFKDGAVYDVTDYWLVDDDELHFTTVDANGNQSEHVVGFSQLDLQRTINVNTDRGFRFVLRNQPVQEYLNGAGEMVPEGTVNPGPIQPPPPQGAPAPPQPNAPTQPPKP